MLNWYCSSEFIHGTIRLCSIEFDSFDHPTLWIAFDFRTSSVQYAGKKIYIYIHIYDNEYELNIPKPLQDQTVPVPYFLDAVRCQYMNVY